MLSLLHRLSAAIAFYLYNSLLSHFPSYGIRHFYLRRILGNRIDSGASVHMGCFITGGNISVGAGTVVNRNCYLDGRGGLVIGSDASISPECYLISLTHDPQDADFGAVAKPVEIQNRVWLGARVIVLPGVRIGEGAIVGAGSTVSRDVEPFTIVAGNPARKIGERNRNLRYSLKYFPLFNTDIQP